MRKLLPSLLIAIMALSVLSCAGVVSAAQPKAIVHPLVIGPSTPQYYPVTAAVGNTYRFYPGDYNYYGTSLYKYPPSAVVAATANPNNGNLNTYESIRAFYGSTYAEAVNGVNLLINAPTAPTPTATTATVTVYEKAAFQVQVANPLNAWGEMGNVATYNYNGFFNGPYDYPWLFTATSGKLTTGVQAMPLVLKINPGLNTAGWDTGSVQTVGGYLNCQSSSTTGTINAQGLVQYIAVQFS